MIIWLKNRLLKLFVIAFYPVKLIPKKKFKSEFDISSISTAETIGLIRRSLRPRSEVTFDKFGKVREDALISSIKDVPGLSLNLLGAEFKPKHIKFSPTKAAGKTWDGKEGNLWWKYISLVVYRVHAEAIYFPFNALHNKTFPYQKNDKETLKIMKKLKPELIPDSSGHKLNGASVVKHSPNNLNYWHVEFRLLEIEPRNEGKEIKAAKLKSDDSKYWANQAAFYALNDILLNTGTRHLDISTCYKIESVIYLN